MCNIILGLPSTGTSLLWCGILVGGAGAFGGGLALGSAFETTGEIVFEATYPISP